MTEIEWSRLKAAEIAALARRDAIVIVPIGATEQHGPHLPTMVDYRCVHEVSHRAARIMTSSHPTIVTPTIPYGMSEHHMSLSGTITLDYATMNAVIRCVVLSAVRHGFKRVFVLNGHGGNTTALQNMIGELTVETKLPLATGTYWDIAAKSIAKLLERQKALLHACEAETSMVMAMTPELVNPQELSQMHGPYIPGLAAIPTVNEGVYRWRQLSSRSPIGVIGDASTASAEKGEKLLTAIAADVADALLNERLWSEPV
ncbi:MAG: creatininase family protein [Alphaproteobacteria bacterium]|nr:creatininase family protein [Alphaproteobacteria bacterium]